MIQFLEEYCMHVIIFGFYCAICKMLFNFFLVCYSGDPTVYETYWRNVGERSAITFTGDQCLSYFANAKNLCWFLEPKLQEEIKRLHQVVGNAKVDDHFIIVGTGSSQLIQAALYAVSPTDHPEPISVVSVAPYYSVGYFGFQFSNQFMFK